MFAMESGELGLISVVFVRYSGLIRLFFRETCLHFDCFMIKEYMNYKTVVAKLIEVKTEELIKT